MTSMTDHRSGADAIVEALDALGVQDVFCVASVHNLPILDALHRRGTIRVINTRHEQGAVHAADGYARCSGRLGVAITSTGPGAANSMGALLEARFSGSPVLMLTGQVESRYLGQGRGFLHEAESQQTMLRTVTKETWSPRRTVDVGVAVLDAATLAMTSSRGPVAVEVPIDLQFAPCDGPNPPAREPLLAVAPSDRLHAAAELLRGAERPLIWSGGGVVGSGASAVVAGFARRLGIPVITTTQGRGVLPEDDPLCLGSLASLGELRELVESADVLLAVGTRFQMYGTDFWTLRLPQALIHIDTEPSVVARTYQPQVAIYGDAATTVDRLGTMLTDVHAPQDWVQRATAARDAVVASARELIGPDYCAIMDSIRTHLPDGGAVVRDATTVAYYWADSLLPIREPRTSVHPGAAAIGPGLPLAMGAVAATSQRGVVIHGDGGIMLTVPELATLAQFDLPLTVCVFNDRGYGILRDIQSATFAGSGHDVDLLTPDFVTLAQSMGVPAERVTSAADFDTAFKNAASSSGPYLIDVDMLALAPMQISAGAHPTLS